MIAWREKFRAFGIHFVATLIVTLISAALIFLVWYPDPFAKMVGGFKLFLLVAGCDLALGPLLSLIVYNSRKTRLALTIDYTIIGIVQMAAFVYGVYSVSQARPAYVVFVKDRLEVIAAGEIADADREEAKKSKYGARRRWGPMLVATFVDPKDRNDALWASLEGRDVGVRPKFYVAYETQIETIKRQAQPLEALERRHPKSQALVADTLAGLGRPASDFLWLPVRHTKGFWTVLIDQQSGYPTAYIPFDPY
jgi:hypothetical protein